MNAIAKAEGGQREVLDPSIQNYLDKANEGREKAMNSEEMIGHTKPAY